MARLKRLGDETGLAKAGPVVFLCQVLLDAEKFAGGGVMRCGVQGGSQVRITVVWLSCWSPARRFLIFSMITSCAGQPCGHSDVDLDTLAAEDTLKINIRFQADSNLL